MKIFDAYSFRLLQIKRHTSDPANGSWRDDAEEALRAVVGDRLRTGHGGKVCPRAGWFVRRLQGSLACPFENYVLAGASHGAEDGRNTAAKVEAGLGHYVDPVVVGNDTVRDAAGRCGDRNLRWHPGSAVVGREDVAQGRGRISRRSMGPGNMQAAAWNHPYLMVIANHSAVGRKNLVAGKKLQTEPGGAQID